MPVTCENQPKNYKLILIFEILIEISNNALWDNEVKSIKILNFNANFGLIDKNVKTVHLA
ncbi:hypothetical protein T07_13227 [Trichinella nelsoni]|uniref:Uncharacterized protein n=1 Tax=Trichinella nelsoni TaxID=6336 RepID=A0A0V0S7U9_9BILA|nr:hypothetical protein T07_13227 [Trichinella nelsoni]